VAGAGIDDDEAEDKDDRAAAAELVEAAAESDAAVMGAESPDPAPVFPVVSPADDAFAADFAAVVAGASG